MCNIDTVGVDWIAEQAWKLPYELIEMSPIEFNEQNRYMPASVSPRFPGFIRFDNFPFWIEIIDSMDVRSPVREGYIKKGAQIAFSTALECVLLYFAAHIRTAPTMYCTADKELASARVELNFLPMFNQSGFENIFQSSDTSSARKTGKTKDRIQWVGGGFLVPQGAQNADKMRQFTILCLLLDELEAWPNLKNEGDPVQLIRERTGGLDMSRKILGGSSPLIKGSSRIEKLFRRGDQRVYKVRCLKCGFPQALRWNGKRENGTEFGFKWDFTSEGMLDLETCRYHCQNCDHAHFEHDKPRLINKENAEWVPTATPVEPNIRSWHIPSMLSPYGGRPWSRCVSMWLAAIDRESGRVVDPDALQVFYNNVLAEPFEIYSGKVSFSMASSHRRPWYRKNEIPNREIEKHCPSGILMLTCTVDVHKGNLAVAVWGWTAGMRCWLVDYIRIEDESEAGCEVIESPAWDELGKMIDDREWKADDGKMYQLALTFVDARWSTSTVVEFCSQYSSGVYPIMGDDKPARGQRIKEFAEFTTQSGTTGYRITVNHYKDRLAPVLRRNWRPEEGPQDEYTFNAPVDTTDDELRELTREVKRKKTLPNGQEEWYWHRPGGAPQELWDLMVYGHAQVEILAWMMCVQHFEVDAVDWPWFWNILEEQKLYFSESN